MIGKGDLDRLGGGAEPYLNSSNMGQGAVGVGQGGQVAGAGLERQSEPAPKGPATQS